jgi:hypothetical protein
MSTERFVIQVKDIRKRQRFAPLQKLIASKKLYKRRAKHRAERD